MVLRMCPLWRNKAGMLVLVCYDVNTGTKEGRRRLRRVAKVCESTGQRVQKSVFECQVDLAKFETLERRLLAEIEPTQDCLRIYRMPETRGFEVKEFGAFHAIDFDAPLVL
jgi:CRISPR-associated protein Cas2